MIIELSRIKIWTQSVAIPDYDTDYSDLVKTKKPDPLVPVKTSHRGKIAEAMEAEEYFRLDAERKAQELHVDYYPCDKRAELYTVNETFVRREHSFQSRDDEASDDSR